MQMLRPVEMPEPMGAEVKQALAFRKVLLDQVARRAREQDLTAMAGRGDTRSPMHVHADIAAVAQLGLAGVQAHPHTYFHARGPVLSGKRPLPLDSGAQGIVRPREGQEERIALNVHDLPAVGGADVLQHLRWSASTAP